ncbi:MAG: ATP-binding protein, partial [Planctomycetaceae bacterium]|nr:ATP-binding protein [Planctomycetaceae bacterium]
MADFEKLGQFYLGKTCSTELGGTGTDELVLYDARDLTTHAICVGMTGSGKTGLCLSLLEEAAIDGIPAICIDPKGDLGNLMLTFPELRPADFEPWVDAAEATRQGLTTNEYAKKTADLWKRGLAEWGQDGARIRRLQESCEVRIYTPASSAGHPLTVLKSFGAPSPQVMNDPEAFRERIMAAVSGLLALLQIDADPIASREHILLSTILNHFWSAGSAVDMPTLIRSIQAPPFDKVGFLDLESFFPSADRFRLAMQRDNLLASPGFAAWAEGDPLDVASLLYTPEGKPRLAIISIAHLSEQERMFFVTILLNEILTWVRSQPGTSSLRALLYMDEVFGYFPPTANPPSKQPMLTLLKQARAFGLGCVLATQNPVDIDYKGLSNAGTWFLGRLQTERDKQRVLEGLEGAAATTGAAFDRSRMEQILAGLSSRVFVMNNVHEDGPVVFRTRWCLSYLRGPITRHQISTLMAPLKTSSTGTNSRSAFAPPATELAHDDARPVLPPGIPEVFFPIRGRRDGIVYRPSLLAEARVHFVDSKSKTDHWDDVTLVCLAGDSVAADPWEEAEDWDEADLPNLTTEPDAPEAVFRDLPAELTAKRSYSSWTTALKNHLYRNHTLPIWQCPDLRQASAPGETEGAFRAKLRHAAHEERDLQVGKLRARYQSRFNTLTDQIRRAEQKIESEKSQKSQKTLSTAVSVGTSILGALFGRKLGSVSNITRAGSALRNASGIAREAEQVRHAEESLAALLQKQQDL